MEEAKELQLIIAAHETNEENPQAHTNGSSINQPPLSQPRRKLISWIRIGIYAGLLLAGQSVATLLGRLYFDKGGKSKWLGTLVQLVGFPILFPYYLIPTKEGSNSTRSNLSNFTSSEPPSTLVLASFYTAFGLIIAADCYLFSVGLMYLPVSTYALLSASQLAFNAFFSFFINSQKFTFYTINSLVLLTVSSVLLVFQSDNEGTTNVSKGKYAIGFICTVGASAGYGLVLSLTQLFIYRVLKRESFSVIRDVIVWQSLVASLATLVGLFVSGEWKGLGDEMSSFGLGKVSYVMVLAWTAIIWQLFSIGSVGLILEVSSLFSNVMSVLGLPIVPILAVFFFHEKMDGIKVLAMFLGVWGFISYAYQNYLDDYGNNKGSQMVTSENTASPQREREVNV